jgi:hypothetical protein
MCLSAGCTYLMCYELEGVVVAHMYMVALRCLGSGLIDT